MILVSIFNCFRKKALYSREAEIFLSAIKKQKKWEPCGGSIFISKNEQNHGLKSEGWTFGLVAPSVFIQLGGNNAGNFFLACRFQIFLQRNVIFDSIFLVNLLKK